MPRKGGSKKHHPQNASLVAAGTWFPVAPMSEPLEESATEPASASAGPAASTDHLLSLSEIGFESRVVKTASILASKCWPAMAKAFELLQCIEKLPESEQQLLHLIQNTRSLCFSSCSDFLMVDSRMFLVDSLNLLDLPKSDLLMTVASSRKGVVLNLQVVPESGEGTIQFHELELRDFACSDCHHMMLPTQSCRVLSVLEGSDSSRFLKESVAGASGSWSGDDWSDCWNQLLAHGRYLESVPAPYRSKWASLVTIECSATLITVRLEVKVADLQKAFNWPFASGGWIDLVGSAACTISREAGYQGGVYGAKDLQSLENHESKAFDWLELLKVLINMHEKVWVDTLFEKLKKMKQISIQGQGPSTEVSCGSTGNCLCGSRLLEVDDAYGMCERAANAMVVEHARHAVSEHMDTIITLEKWSRLQAKFWVFSFCNSGDLGFISRHSSDLVNLGLSGVFLLGGMWADCYASQNHDGLTVQTVGAYGIAAKVKVVTGLLEHGSLLLTLNGVFARGEEHLHGAMALAIISELAMVLAGKLRHKLCLSVTMGANSDAEAWHSACEECFKGKFAALGSIEVERSVCKKAEVGNRSWVTYKPTDFLDGIGSRKSSYLSTMQVDPARVGAS